MIRYAGRRRRPHRLAVCAGFTTSVAIAVAAVGGTSSASTIAAHTRAHAASGTAQASHLAASAEQPVSSWSGFGPPVKPRAKQHIVAIECSSLGVGCVQTAQGVQQADNVLGWSTSIVNGQGDPTVWNSSIEDAVAAKANGIVLVNISPSLVKAGIAKAKAAHIPVIAAGNGPAADGLVLENAQQGGNYMAAYLASVAKSGLRVLVLDDGEFPLTARRNGDMKTELTKLCPSCKATTVEFTFATMATKLAQQVTAALQANPSIGYVVVPFDAAVTFVRQGIKAAGSKAKVASFEGNPSTLATLGDGVQVADVAAPNFWLGWQATDDIIRLQDHKPVKSTALPVRLFVASNRHAALKWTGDVNFQAKYKKLWGKS